MFPFFVQQVVQEQKQRFCESENPGWWGESSFTAFWTSGWLHVCHTWREMNLLECFSHSEGSCQLLWPAGPGLVTIQSWAGRWWLSGWSHFSSFPFSSDDWNIDDTSLSFWYVLLKPFVSPWQHHHHSEPCWALPFLYKQNLWPPFKFKWWNRCNLGDYFLFFRIPKLSVAAQVPHGGPMPYWDTYWCVALILAVPNLFQCTEIFSLLNWKYNCKSVKT